MKFDPQKTFPYPVLRPHSDDYIEADFQAIVDASYHEEKKTIRLDVEFHVSADRVSECTTDGSASFSIVVSCRETYYREPFFSHGSSFIALIPADQLRGEVVIESYIVATREIEDFDDPDINREFGCGPFVYKAGQVLALDEPQTFFFDRELFRPISSVFELVVNEDLVGGDWEVYLENDRVQIGVGPILKQRVDNARNNPVMQAILINSIYFAAVIHAIERLIESDDLDMYRWAQVITEKAHNKGLKLEDVGGYKAATELMDFPLMLMVDKVFPKGDE